MDSCHRQWILQYPRYYWKQGWRSNTVHCCFWIVSLVFDIISVAVVLTSFICLSNFSSIVCVVLVKRDSVTVTSWHITWMDSCHHQWVLKYPRYYWKPNVVKIRYCSLLLSNISMYLLGHMSYLDNTQRRNVYQVGLLSRVLRMSGLIFYA